MPRPVPPAPAASAGAGAPDLAALPPGFDPTSLRFALAWVLPLGIAAAAWRSPWAAWAAMLGWQVLFALLEFVPALKHSPPAARASGWHRWCIRMHVPLQAALLGFSLWLVARGSAGGGLGGSGGFGVGEAIALGIAVGGVTGSHGITFAHELGHSRSRLDRLLGWLLMTSVLYAHFMVEHYRGHHPRAATRDDPASARRGETLWRFLPRTLAGSWLSAWRLEAAQLAQLRRGGHRSPLAWAAAAQAAGLVMLALWLGPLALLFWVVQAGYAVFLLEAINYIEHYGLVRASQANGRPEPFGVNHAWNADHLVTNSVIANLQRHSDHHMHAWKPYAELQPLPGPELPTGYAGCLFLASVPRWWFAAMEPRLQALERIRAPGAHVQGA
ncbi:MAG: alkane 1-monooxygenase [Rubrivivax sp.]|nr:alkane 1-monooxygenase [Rubrivivax sp.]